MDGLQRHPVPAFRAMSFGIEDGEGLAWRSFGEGLACCRKIISPRTKFSVEEMMAQIILAAA